MSKRASVKQNNTLLNYFSSPKQKVEARSPKNVEKKIEANDDSSEENIIEPVKKKRLISESDSDQNNSTSNVEKSTKKRKIYKKRSHRISSSSSSEEGEANQSATKSGKDKKKALKKRKRILEDSESESDDNNKSLALKFESFKKCTDQTPVKSKDNSLSTAATSSSNLNCSIDSVALNNIAKTSSNTNWLHNRLEFLQPDNIRDINKNRPGDQNYDSRTLFVPDDFLDKQTPAMRQWWILKSTHYDCVIFFKVGKFYELYHMDAVVGVVELGFSYMKGEFAHSGFPEIGYYNMANSLITKGYKVARTEQTETPEMMTERCKNLSKVTKFDKVVNREVCQISAKGALVVNAQLSEVPNLFNNYMIAVTEKVLNPQVIRFGVCFIDSSIGVFKLSEFDDDKHCSRLLNVFAENSPELFLIEQRKASPTVNKILNSYYPDVRKELLVSDTEFYDATRTIDKLKIGGYFVDKNNKLSLPKLITDIIEDINTANPKYELAVRSLGACLWYLEYSKLDIQVVSMGQFELYTPPDMSNRAVGNFMVLDSVALKNLNLLEGKGSLYQIIDKCQSAFGKRLLKLWICRPLCTVEKINERQEAIKELHDNLGLLQETQEILKKLPDLERQITKINMYGNKRFSQKHPDSRAIFYDAKIYSKRRVHDLLKTLAGFEQAQQIKTLFKDCKSTLLISLTQFEPDGNNCDLSEHLKYFKSAFAQKEAEKEGKIIPREGISDEYDEAQRKIADINSELEDYLNELKKQFSKDVCYFGSDKKRFQIEIPDKFSHKVDDNYRLESTRKGAKPCKRFSTPRSRGFLVRMMKAEEERTKVIKDLNRCIFENFGARHEQWQQTVTCLSNLDVLCSLAGYARASSHDICLPNIKPFAADADLNEFVIENGRHPCLLNLINFVPNDIKMGIVDNANIFILTGPNMGGKSTLMRQVALIAVMAQIGSYVPATYCRLNLIDRIFTRLGAHDDIIKGQSTFLVELSEAASILKHVTPFSLILLDELGRGTSTHDGNAIAVGYVQKLTEIKCRTLFSTHYHNLVDYFVDNAEVQLGYMACLVENEDDPVNENITYLYKLVKGRCPKSYGFNVARLAGVAANIISRAREVAKTLEDENRNRHLISKLFSTSTSIADVKNMINSL